MSHFYDLDQIKYRRQPKYFRKGNLAAAARRSRGRKRLLIARTLPLPPFYVNSGQILDETRTVSSVNLVQLLIKKNALNQCNGCLAWWKSSVAFLNGIGKNVEFGRKFRAAAK